MSDLNTSTDPKQVGKWEKSFPIENVACHATLLPNRKILCWSRRSDPMSPTADMNEHKTNAFLINLRSKNDKGELKCEYTGNQPQSLDFKSPSPTKPDPRESDISLFCSGHCLLPDGNLFVVGGHISDGRGLKHACIYDWTKDRWVAKDRPSVGRWYPSALTLPDGSVLTISGNTEDGPLDQLPQIWRGTRDIAWEKNFVRPASMLDPNDREHPLILDIYPHLHLDPSGQIFMAGPRKQALFLNLSTTVANQIGEWGQIRPQLTHSEFSREFGASVTYDAGKVMWTGGGSGAHATVDGFLDVPGPPTSTTEIIDLNDVAPEWKTSPTMKMKFERRQHNLTTLPDGTVLVTGGTRGPGFNDLRDGSPVHEAELWNPVDKKWTVMAAEDTDRCYHGVALLLPDGSVLSAGSGEGGEFDNAPNPRVRNPRRNNHTNAQIYKPPYFFVSDPPQVTGVPDIAKYGQSFEATVQGNHKIKRVSWIRLPSVTHTINSSQSVYFEVFKDDDLKGGKFKVTPPNNRNVATPGPYMLFFVNKEGRPSEAAIVTISNDTTAEERTKQKAAQSFRMSRTTASTHTVKNLPELDEKVIAEQDRPAVKVGITPVCPYGLGTCWAGAFEALHHIEDIDVVRPLPDQDNSVAFVYLKEDKLPDLDVWRKEFGNTAGGAHDLRGIEITVTGTVTKGRTGNKDNIFLSGTSTRAELALAPFKAESKLERDHKACALMPVSEPELSAYESLYNEVLSHHKDLTATVTGRLHKLGENEFCLDVKESNVIGGAADV